MSWYNPYIFVPLLAWLLAHTIKFLRQAIAGDINLRHFYLSGGMPSGHSATVLALATTALVYDGWNSSVFGLAAVFAVIVLYDSFGVRRAAGEQAQAINKILSGAVREVTGHKPSEVLWGAGLGTVVAFAMTANRWTTNAGWLVEPAQAVERYTYLGIFIAMLAGSIAAKIIINRCYKKRAKSVKQLKQSLSWSLVATGMIGLLISLLQFQQIPNADWRLWPLLLVAVFLTAQTALAMSVYSKFQAQYREESARLNELRKRDKRK